MVAQLIWIAVVYVSAAVIIHILHNRQKVRKTPQSVKWIHYIFITRNHASVVEWYIRALTFQAFLTGKRFRVTFMDDDSSDGTLGIVSKMAASGCSIDLATSMYTFQVSEEELQQQGIVVDLRLSGQSVSLPFMGMAGSRGCESKRDRF
jgi:hypothetical protein